MNSSSTVKTILFWISIVFLGVMLWKLVSANGQSAREHEPSYSEFMDQVDQGDVKEVTMYLSPNSYELQGEYVKPDEHEISRDDLQGIRSGHHQGTARQGRLDQGEGSAQRRLDFDSAECCAVDCCSLVSACS